MERVIAERGRIALRPLDIADGPSLANAYRRNREALAPWEPLRDDGFFSDDGQGAAFDRLLAARAAGAAFPCVMVRADRIVGLINLSAVEHGAFSSGRLGYWVDEDERGRGLARWAVGEVVREAREEHGLHRLEAATLVHNRASQRVLEGNLFTPIGLARDYLKIAGRWQDHVLYQRILRTHA